MLDQPPEVKLSTDEIIPIMVNQQFDGILLPLVNNYSYWDKVKYKSRTCTPDELWSSLKLYRRLRYYYIHFSQYKFAFMLTDTMQRLLHELDLNIGGNLSSNIGIAESDKTKFVVNAVMEEAISSSQIEGAVTTRKKAKELLRQEKKPRNKSDQMIVNNFITMKYILEHKNEALTLRTILHIHQLMTSDTLDEKEDEGRFRATDAVFIINHSNSGIVHTPPPNREIESIVDDLCIFFNNDSEPFIHPIVKACIVHFMIGWLHPFVDGNGRTARALFYWYMLKNGYWLTEFLSISRIIQDTKVQYENAYLYTESDDKDVGYFIHYHLKTMDKAFKALKQYISKKQQEISQAARFMKIPGVNDRMAQVLKIIHDDGDRVLTAKEVANRFAISDFTARMDLKALEQLGYLDVIPVNKQKKSYIKSNGFDRLISKL